MTIQVFKHMMPKDIPVFSTYIFTPEGQSYTSWEFDVLLGDPHDPGPFYPLAMRRQALALGALKVDAIGWLASTPTLIEVKPDATLGAIGQIESYADWFRVFFHVYPRKMIVCESMRKQVQDVCNWKDIQVRIVPPANELTVQRAEIYALPLIQPSPLGPNPLDLPQS